MTKKVMYAAWWGQEHGVGVTHPHSWRLRRVLARTRQADNAVESSSGTVRVRQMRRRIDTAQCKHRREGPVVFEMILQHRGIPRERIT